MTCHVILPECFAKNVISIWSILVMEMVELEERKLEKDLYVIHCLFYFVVT